MEELSLGADVTGVWGSLLYMDVYEGSGEREFVLGAGVELLALGRVLR
jgi:hypothetical protein